MLLTNEKDSKRKILSKFFIKNICIGIFICCSPYVMAVASGTNSGPACGEENDEWDDYGDFAEPDKPDYNLESHTKNMHSAALALFNYLDKNVEKLALVARVGGDLSIEQFKNPSQPKYTHVGLVWKSSEDGKWRFRHVLNICRGPSAQIFVQNLAEFFNDEPHFYDVRVGIPSVHLQNKIARILENGFSHVVFIPQYSNIANPFHIKYQNSNGWVLNVVAMAQSSKIISANNTAKNQSANLHSNLELIKKLQQYYGKAYVPSRAFVTGMRQFGAGLFVSNVAFDDHSSNEIQNNWFNFVSVESVFQYLKKTDHFIDTEICHQGMCNQLVSELNR